MKSLTGSLVGTRDMNIATVEKQPQDNERVACKSTASVADDDLMLVPVALQTLSPTAVLDYDIYLWANDKSAGGFDLYVLAAINGFAIFSNDRDI